MRGGEEKRFNNCSEEAHRGLVFLRRTGKLFKPHRQPIKGRLLNCGYLLTYYLVRTNASHLVNLGSTPISRAPLSTIVLVIYNALTLLNNLHKFRF